ncbi:MAG TPA: helix-turn-helix transcriptional regulator [Ignavibacteriaceae bacterium]|nr:helix-turn-helix transcriptional regulator [Ignavibacteriaceae bacterium]
MTFGEFVKHKRLEADLSLRNFCEQAGLDPSNWSKIERNRLNLTLEDIQLKKLAELINIKEGTPEYIRFMDLAVIAKGIIPVAVYSDAEVLEALPVLFRTATGERPTQKEKEKLIELIKNR